VGRLPCANLHRPGTDAGVLGPVSGWGTAREAWTGEHSKTSP
jgi:hypothetical protein